MCFTYSALSILLAEKDVNTVKRFFLHTVDAASEMMGISTHAHAHTHKHFNSTSAQHLITILLKTEAEYIPQND